MGRTHRLGTGARAGSPARAGTGPSDEAKAGR